MDSELNFELLKEIVEKVELKDVLLIASVPVIAGIVFLLPSSIQEMLALNYKDPNPITLFTKVFVHSGVDHLSNNLVAYVFFVVPSLVMTALVQQKRKFYLFFFFFVLVFPFVLSPLNLYYINAETGRGLSGVVSALLGFMPVSVYLFLKEKISDNLNVSFSLSVVTFALGAIAFLYVDVLLQKVLSLVVIYSLGCIFLWFSVREVEFSGLNPDCKWRFSFIRYFSFIF